MKKVIWGVLLVGTVATCRTVLSQTYVFIDSPAITTVTDESGEEYEIPFFGGFNNPVPQLIDIDADGDLDLFVQEIKGHIQFYRNVGSASDAKFTLEERTYQDLEVGTWFQFANVDADQDYDLLTGQTFNAVRYYQNIGSPEHAGFRLGADSLRTGNGDVLTTEPPNIPVIADMDCDGNMDLLLGRVSGSVTHYEQTGLLFNAPQFDFVGDNYQGILVVGEAGKDGQHGANALAAGDINGDTFLDLLWGDFFEPSLIEFRNNSTNCATTNLVRQSDTLQTSNEGPFVTRGYNLPSIGDLNGDGMNDVVAGVASNATIDDERNLFLFQNEGSSVFLQKTSRLISGIDVGSSSVPAFGDIDGDGDKDLVVGNSIGDSGLSGELSYFRRDGNEFALVSSDFLDVQLGFSYNPDFGDLDNDGDDDLVVGLFDGSIVYLRNNGFGTTPQFQVVTLDVLNEDVGSNAAPSLVDLDADGDLDLVVGESSGILNYFRNQGTPESPQYELVPGLFDGFDFGQNSVPASVNYRDCCGPVDVVVGSESEGLFLLRNSGTDQNPVFAEATQIELDVPPKSAPRFDVIDTFDVEPDLVLGNVSGGLVFFAHAVFGATSDTETPTIRVPLEVYPNPATESVHVVFELERPTGIELVVRDLLGRSISRQNIGLQPQGSLTHTLPTSDLAAGIYFVDVRSESRMLGTATFVVQ